MHYEIIISSCQKVLIFEHILTIQSFSNLNYFNNLLHVDEKIKKDILR